ncbi:MAG TPA: S8 family serine peptidase, partial [Longimicrobium sp.]|nr:S8 family serine peptidase [Longimicrobium sp.]
MQRSRISAVLALAALAACSDGVEPTAVPSQESLVQLPTGSMVERVMPGEVVVKMRGGADAAAVARTHGVSVGSLGSKGAVSVLRGAAGSERALAALLSKDARVEYAEPNYLRQPNAIDPRLWAFRNPGALTVTFTSGGSKGKVVNSMISVSDADEDNIEAFGAGGAPVVIGSIDTGVNMSHTEFLPGQLIAGRDWYSNDNNPTDTDNHGTHTTGTMVGRTVGVAGIAGAGPNVKVYVQRVCGRNGCPVSAIASAIRAAADYPNMVAVNVSIGGTSLSQSERDAIAYATGKNVLVIASAGNSNVGTVDCPACDPNAISVGATTWSDTKAYYSSWGPGLDISAPGGELYSNTTSQAGIYSSLRSGYGYMQGTSMAAPQVTGAAAVVASKTGLRGAALRARLEGTTDDIGAGGYDTTFGNGRLNVYRAVTNTSLAGIYSSLRSGYGYKQGTSMAAPQVTGAAAVVASKTGLRGAALRARLEGTTDD